MTTEQKIISAKVGLLELAKQLGNVSPELAYRRQHGQGRLNNQMEAATANRLNAPPGIQLVVRLPRSAIAFIANLINSIRSRVGSALYCRHVEPSE